MLRQPFWLEATRQRARTQKSRLVALAFFFCKTDHLDVERQALALALQFAHAGHGHKYAEASVVFAAVANGVVVAAGQQSFNSLPRWGMKCFNSLPRWGRVGVGASAINADHIAHRVDAHLVKAAVLHRANDRCSAGAMRVGEVSHRQLAFFQILRVAELRQ